MMTLSRDAKILLFTGLILAVYMVLSVVAMMQGHHVPHPPSPPPPPMPAYPNEFHYIPGYEVIV